MKQDNQFTFTTGVIGYPILFIMLMWLVFWFEIRFGFDFNSFGVYPRSAIGLRGILASPFIHGDLTHLWHNTLPILILSMALFFFYPRNAWSVLLLGALLTGICTWLFGRPANHIGASGVVYMLFGFLFFKGVVAKHLRLIALSFVVVFIYGSMVWYTLPIDPKISWEGHLSGLVVGAVLKHFDEHGNFIERVPEEEIQINYEYKENKLNDKD